MWRRAAEELAPAKSVRAAWCGAVLAGFVGLVTGALTDRAQTWLSGPSGSFANSAGTWVLVAFLVAFGGSNLWRAIVRGGVCMVGLVAGYYITAAARGVAIASSSVAFWVVIGLAVGPLVGMAAGWVRYGRSFWAGAGSGTIGGLLAGEAIYGLCYLGESTSATYWAFQILVAVGLAGGAAWGVTQRPASVCISMFAFVAVAGFTLAIERSV
jgi:hypothetical protein